VRPGVRLLLENLRPGPAYVLSRTLDILAANPGGLQLYAGIDSWPVRQRNLARYHFLHPAARDVFPEWDTRIRGCVARLRAQAGTDPDAPDLAQLVGELLLKSADFTRLWERYDVRPHRPGQQALPPPAGRRPHPRLPVHAARRHSRAPPRRLLRRGGSPDHDAMVLLDMLGTQHTPGSADRTADTGHRNQNR
jgi:hypothetical protein